MFQLDGAQNTLIVISIIIIGHLETIPTRSLDFSWKDNAKNPLKSQALKVNNNEAIRKIGPPYTYMYVNKYDCHLRQLDVRTPKAYIYLYNIVTIRQIFWWQFFFLFIYIHT